MAGPREEIDEILVDAYGEYEQMASWECAFTDGVAVPLQASLLGVPVQVQAFQTSDSNRLQCLVVRQQEKRQEQGQHLVLNRMSTGKQQRWISVEELDDENLPKECAHLLSLYKAWLEGTY